MGTVLSYQRAASPLWVEDSCPQQAVVWGQPPSTARPDAAAEWAAALEHEGRGLLNLIAIASRCVERAADEGERGDWLREINRTRGRLERLYCAGLQRDFLKEASAGAGLPHSSTSPTGVAAGNEDAKGQLGPPAA